MIDETNTQTTDPPPENTEQADERDYETEARKTGWRPETEFHGAPDKWMPAKEWVERGETFIPYLRNSQKELRRQIEERDARMQDMDRRLRLANKALEELKETVDDQTVEGMEADLVTIEDQIVAAREAGDARTEVRLTRQYNDKSAEIRVKKAGESTGKRGGVTEGSTTTISVTDPPARTPADDPVFQGWVSENEWFREDPAMTGAAVALMQQFNNDPEFKKLTPRERLDKVGEETKKRFNYGQNARRGRANKVEGARNDGGSGGGSGKGYQNLPREAQAECDNQAKRFIGKADAKGKVKYKTIEDYRASYAADYFADDWGSRQMNA